ncbi:MAG TPA: hypothetical protein VGC67_09040 [Cellulomonas sp.]
MRRRIVLSWCALLGVAALTTAAVVTDSEDVDALFLPGAGLDLVVAGSAEPGWTPDEEDWDQGRPSAYQIVLGDETSALDPGDSLTFRVAARHGDQDLAATVRIEITDPDPAGDATDALTGRRVELFDQLRIRVADAGTGQVLIDAAPGSGATARTYAWPDEWAPGESRLLDVTVTVPAELGDAWQGAVTDLQIHFASESV